MNETASQPSSATSMMAGAMRLRVALVGLAMDFWKDSPFPWEKWGLGARPEKKVHVKRRVDVAHEEVGQTVVPDAPKIWTGDRIQMLERMWGEGHTFPGNDHYIDSLVTPLGLNSELSVLDLSAGLGGLGRKLSKDYGTYVTGMEPDQALAARGMIMSIAAGKSKQASVIAYDTATFSPARKYDCIFARELFFRVVGKEKFFQDVSESLKSGGGQIVFTDYILDHKHREDPAVKMWMQNEPYAAPLSSIEMIKHWKGLGYDMRIAEDQTDLYKKEILKGFRHVMEFLGHNIPDDATKPIVVHELNLWIKRLIAFEGGLRYYRFYGLKH